jgi:hypothetical protein
VNDNGHEEEDIDELIHDESDSSEDELQKRFKMYFSENSMACIS